MIFVFCIFLDPSTLQNSLKSRRFLPDSFGFSKFTIISLEDNETFAVSFPMIKNFIYFSFHTIVTGLFCGVRIVHDSHACLRNSTTGMLSVVHC